MERDQERSHDRGLTTIFGKIRVKRLGYGAEGVDSLHPLDAETQVQNLPFQKSRTQIKLLILPTAQANEALRQKSDETNAILHVTC